MADSYRKIVGLAVALIIVAVIYPIALGLIGNSGNVVVNATNLAQNGSRWSLEQIIDPTILVLLITLIPIIAIIAVVMMFLPKSRKT